MHRQCYRFQQTKYLIEHYHFEPGNVMANYTHYSHYKVQWVQSPKIEILIHLLQLAHRGWTGCDGEREAWKQTLCWTYQSSSRLCMTYRNLFALSQNRIVPFFKCTDVIIDVCAAIRFSNGDSRIKRRVKCSSSASICVLNVEVGFVCLFWPR